MSLREIIWLGKIGLTGCDLQGPTHSHILVSVPSHPGWVLLIQPSNPFSPTSGLPLPFRALDVALIQHPDQSPCFRCSLQPQFHSPTARVINPKSTSDHVIPLKWFPLSQNKIETGLLPSVPAYLPLQPHLPSRHPVQVLRMWYQVEMSPGEPSEDHHDPGFQGCLTLVPTIPFGFSICENLKDTVHSSNSVICLLALGCQNCQLQSEVSKPEENENQTWGSLDIAPSTVILRICMGVASSILFSMYKSFRI